jgi:subtilisin family serine protease
MSRRSSIWLLFATLFLWTHAFAGAPRVEGMGERILVTIRYDAIDAMHGDAVERYHRPHDYAAGANTELILDALATEYAIVRVSGWPMRSLSVHCEVYALAPGADAEGVAARLARDSRVDSAEPLRRFQTLTAPGVAFRPLQHALDELDVDHAHALSRGRGIRIAVIDSGIDASHPDLNGAVGARRDFASGVPAAHGTEVAGVIAARGNGVGIVGVAPEAELLDLRACWSDGSSTDPASCDSFSLAQALDYAVTNPVDVINLSLAGPEDPLLARLLAAAESRAISVVAAAPVVNDAAHGFPTSVRSVIVGICADMQGVGAAAAIRAPGTDVLTTFPGARYDYASGSSLAAAHVSGVVALARSLQRQLSPQQIRTLLTAHTPLSAATVLADAATLR